MSKALIAAMIALLAASVPASAAFDPNRIVTAVDHAAKIFSCQAKPGEATHTYKTTSKTVFRVNGRRVRLSYIWDKGSLSELKMGQVVTVQYHMSGRDRIADRVAIYPKKQ
jgi:hypothetical protein